MKTVTAAIITDKGRVLLARRAPGENLSGRWEFPGGKMEEGESLEECIRREIHEELGLEVVVSEVFARTTYHGDPGPFEIIALRAEVTAGCLRLTVHDRAEWVSIQGLLAYNLAPADIYIARKLQEAEVEGIRTGG
jgi:8-oxo-dGTP diphosphatase